jgi:hypothetical protein
LIKSFIKYHSSEQYYAILMKIFILSEFNGFQFFMDTKIHFHE